MSKWFGEVAFGYSKETKLGVWEQITETRHYYGDFKRRSSKWQSADKLNDDLNISVELSIVADEFLLAHSSSIKYVVMMGTKWKVTGIRPAHPRLVLEIGGVYNEPA